MTDIKPTAAEQFAAFFEAALPPRNLSALFDQPDPETDTDYEETDR